MVLDKKNEAYIFFYFLKLTYEKFCKLPRVLTDISERQHNEKRPATAASGKKHVCISVNLQWFTVLYI